MRLQFVGIIDLIFYNKLRLLVRQNYGKITSFYLDSRVKQFTRELQFRSFGQLFYINLFQTCTNCVFVFVFVMYLPYICWSSTVPGRQNERLLQTPGRRRAPPLLENISAWKLFEYLERKKSWKMYCLKLIKFIGLEKVSSWKLFEKKVLIGWNHSNLLGWKLF